MKKKPIKDDEAAAEALISKGGEESDVDEDQVADLSTVPTPVIGFKMPKLNNNLVQEGHKTLTANLLNNSIVNMRSIVEKAKFFEETQCKRKMKRLQENTKADDTAKSKISRLQEDIMTFKNAVNDDVAKFAILNKNARGELLSKKDITSAERSLYLLATSKTVLKAVENFRKTFSDWEVKTAYFLQRLGQQYQTKKEEENGQKNEKKKKKRKTKEMPAKDLTEEETPEPETSKTVVKKVKLSQGGVVDVGKPSTRISKKSSSQTAEDTKKDEDVEESGFFLSSTGQSTYVPPSKPVVERVKRTKAALKPKEEESLHPSWEAKLKKKKQMENIQPQGKKIVFDEDD